jgi:hypothetical protein
VLSFVHRKRTLAVDMPKIVWLELHETGLIVFVEIVPDDLGKDSIHTSCRIVTGGKG